MVGPSEPVRFCAAAPSAVFVGSTSEFMWSRPRSWRQSLRAPVAHRAGVAGLVVLAAASAAAPDVAAQQTDRIPAPLQLAAQPSPPATMAGEPGGSAPSVPQGPDGATALLRGQASDAVSAYTEALKQPGLANDRRAALLNDRAVAYVRLGQTKAAIEDYNHAVQLFPEYAVTYNNRGNLLLALGLAREALKDLDRAILLAPGYAAAYNNRGAAHMKLGEHADAIRDYTKAITLLPSNPAPLAGRGRALLVEGRPHSAIRDLSRAVAADARFAAAYRSRAEAKLEIQRTEEAIEDFSRAAAFDSSNSEIYLLRGQAYLAGGNAASAIKDFSRVVELEPNAPSGWRARGLANGMADGFEDALADLNKAIELDPRSGLTYAYRAIVYKLSGQLDVGQRDLDNAVKLDPERAEVLWARGELAEEAGNNDAAIADLRKALALKPGLRQASLALERLGAGVADAGDQPVAQGGLDKWRLVRRQNAYFALNDDHPRLRVPLEVTGDAVPRLIDWEVKKAPFKGIGVLRFDGGAVQGKAGPEAIELAAIVDVIGNSVVAIEPNKLGQKTATWTWDDGKVVVASADGVTDEFVLRANAKPKDEEAVAEAKPKRQGGGGGERSGNPGWQSWQQQAQQRPKKPKTIFDLLFGN